MYCQIPGIALGIYGHIFNIVLGMHFHIFVKFLICIVKFLVCGLFRTCILIYFVMFWVCILINFCNVLGMHCQISGFALGIYGYIFSIVWGRVFSYIL